MSAPTLDLIALIDQRIAAALAARDAGADPDPLVPHDSVGDTPRHVAALCRAGKIEGAKKQGHRWWFRRSAWEAYIASGEAPTVARPRAANDADVEPDAVDLVLQRVLRRAR